MLDFDTYKDIDGINFLNKKDRSPYFTNYEHIYPWTNENLRDFFDMFDVKEKKVLCPTSSGDHFLNLALEGATDITCFDINRLSKYYQELKIAFIKKLDYSDFKNILFSNSVYTCLITYFLKNGVQLKKDLKESVYEFWSNVVKQYEINSIMSRDVQVDAYWNNKYLLNEKNYYQLKNRLKTVKLRYLDCDIKNLHKITQEKYDYIFTSNIFYYLMKNGSHKGTFDDLINLIGKNGQIVQYSFMPNHTNDLYFEERRKLDAKILYRCNQDNYIENIYTYRRKND